MLAHEAVEYRRREEPASVGRRSALPLPPDTTHADAADALCALAQATLDALRRTRRALKWHRSMAVRSSLRIYVERSPYDWIVAYDRGQWHSSHVREASAAAAHLLEDHQRTLERALLVASRAVAQLQTQAVDVSASLGVIASVLAVLQGRDAVAIGPRVTVEDLNGVDVNRLLLETVDEVDEPSALSRHWLKWIAAAVAGVAVVVVALHNRSAIADAVVNVKATTISFFNSRVHKPLADMYRNVRYGERRFQVADANALQAERASLARMVGGYLAKVKAANADEAAASASRTGDIAPVMPYYEREIAAPLRNAISGDLIQLLLIQVQRAKTDVAMSLAAVDHIISANEVNFQLLSAIPVGFVVYFGVTAIGRALFNRNPYGSLHKQSRRHMGRALHWASVGQRDVAARHCRVLHHVDRVWSAAQLLVLSERRPIERACRALAWEEQCDPAGVVQALALQNAVFH